MKKLLFLLLTVSVMCSAQDYTEKIPTRDISIVKSDLMTPEVLWSLGRIGDVKISFDGKKAVYSVSYYSIEQNKSKSVLYLFDMKSCAETRLTQGDNSESSAVFINNDTQLLFLSKGQLWVMNTDGFGRKQVKTDGDVDEFLLSPDEKKIILVRQVETNASIQKNPADLSKSTGMVINDMVYKHWDHFVKTIPHPFVAYITDGVIGKETDILNGQPFECPMLPFGSVEELSWSPDSRTIAYSCRKKTGRAYAMSTDSDIFLYDTQTGSTTNICKPAGYQEKDYDCTRSLQTQSVNDNLDLNMGYDLLPKYSPDGKYIAWTSMPRDGYESDRTRLCVYEIATGKKTYITESFESGVDTYCWDLSSKSLYFTGTWHGTTQAYSVDLNGTIKKLTLGDYDYSICCALPDGKQLLVKKQSMSRPNELFVLNTKAKPEKNLTQITHENNGFFEHLSMGDVKERWVTTVDNKQMLCWVVYPPHFDSKKKYPTLLFCEGGPQSPVSQGWSYRWNFQLMAAKGYIVILPSRRGVPGFGMEWLEEISGDYTGLCMQDYLSAIDDLCKESYVDRDRLGCVGASFGGFSVYWLAGHHDGRFKAFIAHDGIYNTQQQYVETDELWFPNWDLKAAPWRHDVEAAQKVYADSPHLSVDKWDTPILCIHGMLDYRIMFTQAESAFQAARMRGIPAQLLLFPDENHWVLKPQNAMLWQRTFFGWLDKWLKK